MFEIIAGLSVGFSTITNHEKNIRTDYKGKLELLDDLLPDKPTVMLFSREPDRFICDKLKLQIESEGAYVIGITPEDTKAVETTFPVYRIES